MGLGKMMRINLIKKNNLLKCLGRRTRSTQKRENICFSLRLRREKEKSKRPSVQHPMFQYYAECRPIFVHYGIPDRNIYTCSVAKTCCCNSILEPFWLLLG